MLHDICVYIQYWSQFQYVVVITDNVLCCKLLIVWVCLFCVGVVYSVRKDHM